MTNRLIVVVNGVLGIREGYSDTSANFFNSFVEANKHVDDLKKEYLEQGYHLHSETRTEQVYINNDDDNDVFRVSTFVTGVLSDYDRKSEWFVFNQLSGLPEETLPQDLWWDNGSAVAVKNWSLTDVLASLQGDIVFENIRDIEELESKLTDMRNGFPVMNEYRTDILHYFPIKK